MDTRNFLIIGQGDIGVAVTNTLVKDKCAVTGLARHQREHYALDNKANFMQQDALTLTAEQLKGFTHFAIIVTPDDYSTSGYEDSYLAICQHLGTLVDSLTRLERIVFISSTGVYGQDGGEWIDEYTLPTAPKRDASKIILQAERSLQESFGSKAVIIRPSGIYGRERLMRLKKVTENPKQAVDAEQWTNRIMDRDLVNIIVNVLTMHSSQAIKSLYIATDYRPVTTLELTIWLSEQLHEPLPEINNKTVISGKRLHSNIPLAWLNYPDWQTGYNDILEQQN